MGVDGSWWDLIGFNGGLNYPKSSSQPSTTPAAPCTLRPPLGLAAAAPPHRSEKPGLAELAAASMPAAVARGTAGCEATRWLQWRVPPSLEMCVDFDNILHQLVTIGIYETLQISRLYLAKPSTRWCRISSIHSMSWVLPEKMVQPISHE